jgi:OHCU decarboxylase
VTCAELDALPVDKAREALTACCGSMRWVDGMVARRPFGTRDVLFGAADDVWRQLGEEEWREAFAHHPRSGEAASGERRSAAWAVAEQSAASGASVRTKTELADVQQRYEQRFGHIFLMCATGKSATEILDAARHRMTNDRATELRVAAEEQRKITRLRLEKLVQGER